MPMYEATCTQTLRQTAVYRVEAATPEEALKEMRRRAGNDLEPVETYDLEVEREDWPDKAAGNVFEVTD